MDFFEYVMVLASIVVGLGLTHLLQGILDLIQERTKPYWVHLVWVAWAFIQAIFWWWWEFRYSETEQWTFPLFMFVICYAFLVYLLCGFLFPKNIQEYGDFRTYFYARKKWFFCVLILFFAADLIDTMLKGMDYFVSLGPIYTIATLIIIAGAFAAALLNSPRYHAVFAIGMVAFQWFWVLRNFYTVA